MMGKKKGKKKMTKKNDFLSGTIKVVGFWGKN
jgi:hypothetical protein